MQLAAPRPVQGFIKWESLTTWMNYPKILLCLDYSTINRKCLKRRRTTKNFSETFLLCTIEFEVSKTNSVGN